MKVPSPGRMLGATGEWLRGARYFLADVFYLIARFPGALAQGVGGFWRALPVVARRRLIAATGAVAAILLAVGVVVPNLPCAFPAGEECPPADDAIGVAPATSVAYLHANIDPETEQAERAEEVVARMPLISRQLIGGSLLRLGGPAPAEATAEPWFAGEVATSLAGAGAELDQVQMLETSDAQAALDWAETLAEGTTESEDYRDVEILVDQRGMASAVVEGFLLLGTREGVRASVDAASGAAGAGSLADDAAAAEALGALPDHRLAEAYLSPDGIESLVADPRGSLAALEPLVDAGASRGAAVALVAEPDGLAIASRSILDAERTESEPGFFAAFEEFQPELPSRLDPESLAYLGLADPRETLEALLGQATVGAPGIAAGVTDLIEELRSAAGVDVQRDLLEAIGGEAAFSVVPREPAAGGRGGQGAFDPATSAVTATPYLEFLAAEVDDEAARDALARLQGPIASRLDAPSFEQRSFGDIEAQVLRISPVAQLVYAVAGSALVIANDPAAVQRLAAAENGGLSDSERYRESLAGLPEEAALVAYLDLRGLLSYAESSGLAEDTAYTAFAPDLRRLASLGLTVSRDEGTLAGDARLLVD